MTTNYARGSAAERRVCDAYLAAGWSARRSAGSRGEWDVIAFNDSEAHLIQVKTWTTRSVFPKQDVQKLGALVTPANFRKFLATWERGKGWASVLEIGSERLSVVPTSFPLTGYRSGEGRTASSSTSSTRSQAKRKKRCS